MMSFNISDVIAPRNIKRKIKACEHTKVKNKKEHLLRQLGHLNMCSNEKEPGF